MYRKLQIVEITSSIIFLKYVVDLGSIITVSEVDPITHELIYNYERVNTVTAAMRTDQFTVDEDLSAVVVSLANKGKTIAITYYTDGTQNPYYASSNLNLFIEKVLSWTDNRICDGLYVYWNQYRPEDEYVKHIKPGSFIYDGNFYVYGGEDFNIRDYAPPTRIGYCRCYKMFINNEILESYVDMQVKLLTRIGIITSSDMYAKFDEAKLDTMGTYDNMYQSQPLDICYMYVVLNEERDYDIWIEYPQGARTL